MSASTATGIVSLAGKDLCPQDVSAPTPTTATSAPATPASQAPTITASQQQALTSAQGYLSDGQGFSRAGLIAQLDSPDGGQFSVADATWAVDNSGADWNAQAVIAAKNYLNDGQGFSRSALIAQLDSPDGGQFTYAQAVLRRGRGWPVTSTHSTTASPRPPMCRGLFVYPAPPRCPMDGSQRHAAARCVERVVRTAAASGYQEHRGSAPKPCTASSGRCRGTSRRSSRAVMRNPQRAGGDPFTRHPGGCLSRARTT